MGTSSFVVYEYDGSLASITAGGVVDSNLINVGGGGLPGTIMDKDGFLSQSDDGVSTFSLDDGSVVDQPIDYIGAGTVSLINLLGIPIDTRDVAVFSANGQIYLIAPQGLPLLSGVSISFDIDANADFQLDPFTPCFLAGTLILTPGGYAPIERLAAGDAVVDANGEVRTIRWTGGWTGSSNNPRDFPVRVPANFFGPCVPFADTWVTQQHRLVMQSPEIGPERVFVRAKLLFEHGLAPDPALAPATFHHLLLDEHVALVANGMEAESLLIGKYAKRVLDARSWAEICEIFPEARDPRFAWTPRYLDLPRGRLQRLRSRQARVVREYFEPYAPLPAIA